MKHCKVTCKVGQQKNTYYKDLSTIHSLHLDQIGRHELVLHTQDCNYFWQASLKTSEAQVEGTKALLQEAELTIQSQKQNGETFQAKLQVREDEARVSSRKARLASIYSTFHHTS